MTDFIEQKLGYSCEWSFPVPILYGPGRLKELGQRTAEMALVNPLIVTDRGSAQLPFISELQQTLAEAGVKQYWFVSTDFHDKDGIREAAKIEARAAITGDEYSHLKAHMGNFGSGTRAAKRSAPEPKEEESPEKKDVRKHAQPETCS